MTDAAPSDRTVQQMEPSVSAKRRMLAVIAKTAAPGYSGCFRCGMPWRFTDGHMTEYEPGRSCFPLCVECWAVLTPQQRTPYYEQLLMLWESRKPVTADVRHGVMEAVAAGG